MRQAGPNVGPVRWRENFLIISANYQRVVAERVGTKEFRFTLQ